jgi:hypothetical protein
MLSMGQEIWRLGNEPYSWTEYQIPGVLEFGFGITSGGAFGTAPNRPAHRQWGFRMNLLLPFVLCAFFPLLAILNRITMQRMGPNSCAECGYDLTGNESGICPECGESTP